MTVDHSLPEADPRLETLKATVDDALVVLQDEREAFLTGAYERLDGIIERKVEVLERIESDIKAVTRSEAAVSMIREVIAAGKRNEQIIEAARQGLAFARRRIAAVNETMHGLVAYAEDGTPISSLADRLGKTTSA